MPARGRYIRYIFIGRTLDSRASALLQDRASAKDRPAPHNCVGARLPARGRDIRHIFIDRTIDSRASALLQDRASAQDRPAPHNCVGARLPARGRYIRHILIGRTIDSRASALLQNFVESTLRNVLDAPRNYPALRVMTRKVSASTPLTPRMLRAISTASSFSA